MLSAHQAAHYLGGVLHFTENVLVESSTQTKVYHKNDEISITPGVLFMIASGVLKKGSFKLVLRRIDQLEDNEVIALSYLAAPEKVCESYLIRRVVRHGSGDSFNFKVIVNTDTYFILFQNGNMATCDSFGETSGISNLMSINGQQPAIEPTPISVENQSQCFMWMLEKHLDIFDLEPRGLALNRETWGSEDYAKDASGRM